MTVEENYYLEEFKKEIRELIANYMLTDGFPQDWEEHYQNKKRLGELLDCGKYKCDGEYDFYQYATKNK